MWKPGHSTSSSELGLSLSEGRAIQRQSIWCAGLSCLSHSSNQTNETDQRDQMDQIPAMSLDMVSGTFSSRKQRDSADSAVQNMVGEVSSSEARAVGHGGSSTESVAMLSRQVSRPLFFAVRRILDKALIQRLPSYQIDNCFLSCNVRRGCRMTRMI